MTAFPIAPSEPLSPAAPPDGGLDFVCERQQDRASVDALIDEAFGPGRFAKSAERLREGNSPRLDLSVCVWADGEIVGAVRQWPILIGETPALFLGPFAVNAGSRRQGLGAALIAEGCALAAAAGERLVLLVGDAAYFQPLGFEPVPPGRVALPGPVDLRRVLWRPLRAGATQDVGGPVRVRRGG